MLKNIEVIKLLFKKSDISEKSESNIYINHMVLLIFSKHPFPKSSSDNNKMRNSAVNVINS